MRSNGWRRVGAGFLLISFLGGPALADRHCAPVLDHYYQARHAILEEGATCQSRLAGAVPRLEDAALAARNCGCDGLRERVEALLDQVEAGDEGQCLQKEAQVLNLADALDRAYEECL